MKKTTFAAVATVAAALCVAAIGGLSLPAEPASLVSRHSSLTGKNL